MPPVSRPPAPIVLRDLKPEKVKPALAPVRSPTKREREVLAQLAAPAAGPFDMVDEQGRLLLTYSTSYRSGALRHLLGAGLVEVVLIPCLCGRRADPELVCSCPSHAYRLASTAARSNVIHAAARFLGAAVACLMCMLSLLVMGCSSADTLAHSEGTTPLTVPDEDDYSCQVTRTDGSHGEWQGESSSPDAAQRRCLSYGYPSCEACEERSGADSARFACQCYTKVNRIPRPTIQNHVAGGTYSNHDDAAEGCWKSHERTLAREGVLSICTWEAYCSNGLNTTRRVLGDCPRGLH